MSNTVPHNGNLLPTLEDQIIAHQHQKDAPLSAEQRAKRFELVCRDAASMEAARYAAGLPEPPPAPWPESTWKFLKEQTRRARA